MDRFLEEVVVKKGRALEEIFFYISFVIMIIAAILGMFEVSMFIQTITTGQMYWLSLIFGLFQLGIAVLLFLYRDRLRTEYEYTFTNGVLDFAQVFNNNKRKSLGSLKINNVEAFGKVSSQSFQRYISTPGVKQKRWFLNRGAELYYFYFVKDSNKNIIVLEPSEEMVSYIKQYLPFGAWQEN